MNNLSQVKTQIHNYTPQFLPRKTSKHTIPFLDIIVSRSRAHSHRNHSMSFCEKDQWSELHEAVYNRDLNRIKQLVCDGLDVDFPDYYGQTALWLASSLGYTNEVIALICLGASVTKSDCYGRTPLHANALDKYASIETIKILIHFGAHCRNIDMCEDTLLHILAKEANVHDVYNDENKIRAKHNALIMYSLIEDNVIKAEDLYRKNKFDFTPYEIAGQGIFGYAKHALGASFIKEHLNTILDMRSKL